MIDLALTCCHCNSVNIVHSGLTRNGKHRYKCNDCHRTSRDSPRLTSYPPAEQEKIPVRMRSAVRYAAWSTFSVSRARRLRLGSKKAATLPALSATLCPPTKTLKLELELDELWSFVLKKARKCWVWIALCRQTRQVVTFVIGDRSAATRRKLWRQIPPAYRQAHCYTDFWEAYQKVIPEDQHTACGKESGLTAHVERWNNTLRQRFAHFVRKTLSFSKSDYMHEVCLRFFIHRYYLSLLPKKCG